MNQLGIVLGALHLLEKNDLMLSSKYRKKNRMLNELMMQRRNFVLLYSKKRLSFDFPRITKQMVGGNVS